MTTSTQVNFNVADFRSSLPSNWLQAYIVNGGAITQTVDLTVTTTTTLSDNGFSGRIYIVSGTGTPAAYTQEAEIIAGGTQQSQQPQNKQRYAVYELNLTGGTAASADVLGALIDGLPAVFETRVAPWSTRPWVGCNVITRAPRRLFG
jgi:hypothetical protein